MTRRKFASSMSANHSQLLLGGIVPCFSGPEARRGSSGGLPEDRGALSVVLVSSCGVVIGYLLLSSGRHALHYRVRAKHAAHGGGGVERQEVRAAQVATSSPRAPKASTPFAGDPRKLPSLAWPRT